MEILACVLFIGILIYTEAEMSTSSKISPTSSQLYQTSGYYNSLQTSNNSYNSVKYYLTSELTSATIQPSSLKTWSSTFNSSTLSIVSTYQQNFRSASSLSHYSELSTLNGSKASITMPTSKVMTIEYRTSEHKSEIAPTINSSVLSNIRIPDIKTSTSVQSQVKSTFSEQIVSSHSTVQLSSVVNQNCSENCHKNDDNKRVPGQEHFSTAFIIILVVLVIIFAVIGIGCYTRRRQICGSLGENTSSASYKRFVDEDREGVTFNSML